MNSNTSCAVLFCLAAASLHAQETPLFNMTSDSGKVFQEIERSDTSSTVEVNEMIGSAEERTMFLLHGSCALMKARNKHAFKVQPLTKHPIRFIIRFLPPGPLASPPADQANKANAITTTEACDVVFKVMGTGPTEGGS
jgi:hypothetical protein